MPIICVVSWGPSRQNVYRGMYTFFFNGSTAPWGPRPPHFSRLHDHTFFRHTTLGRTPLDEGSACRIDLYLTTHNTHKRQTSMPPVGFEPTILVSERPQTHALDRTAIGIGNVHLGPHNICSTTPFIWGWQSLDSNSGCPATVSIAMRRKLEISHFCRFLFRSPYSTDCSLKRKNSLIRHFPYKILENEKIRIFSMDSIDNLTSIAFIATVLDFSYYCQAKSVSSISKPGK
jgi:hypothetical protein